MAHFIPVSSYSTEIPEIITSSNDFKENVFSSNDVFIQPAEDTVIVKSIDSNESGVHSTPGIPDTPTTLGTSISIRILCLVIGVFIGRYFLNEFLYF